MRTLTRSSNKHSLSLSFPHQSYHPILTSSTLSINTFTVHGVLSGNLDITTCSHISKQSHSLGLPSTTRRDVRNQNIGYTRLTHTHLIPQLMPLLYSHCEFDLPFSVNHVFECLPSLLIFATLYKFPTPTLRPSQILLLSSLMSSLTSTNPPFSRQSNFYRQAHSPGDRQLVAYKTTETDSGNGTIANEFVNRNLVLRKKGLRNVLSKQPLIKGNIEYNILSLF